MLYLKTSSEMKRASQKQHIQYYLDFCGKEKIKNPYSCTLKKS